MKRVLMALSIGLCSALSHAQFADEFVGQFSPLTPSAKASQWSIKMVNHGYEVTSPKRKKPRIWPLMMSKWSCGTNLHGIKPSPNKPLA